MTPTPWSTLPNAAHIDRVLASLKAEPGKWDDAWDTAWNTDWVASRDAAWVAAWNTDRDASRDAAWDTARDAARDTALDAAWATARDAARVAAWDAAWGALAALIAWDGCAYLLDWPENQVQAHYELTGEPAALLLLPAVIVFAQGETTLPATRK